MGLFRKLFSKRIDPDSERMRQIFEKAIKNSEKPQGAYKMVLLGAETRHRLLNLVEEVEAEIGRYAFAIIEDTGVMWVHPKLIERLRTC